MTKDESLLKRRLLDLATKADRRGVFTCSDFLGLNEQNILHSMDRELRFVRTGLYGGYPGAERVMAGFAAVDGTGAGEDMDPLFPIACIRIRSRMKGEPVSFSHRDVLGSVLNLGLDRGRIGDILLREEDVLLFCSETNADFLCSELSRIRHTPVTASAADFDVSGYSPKTQRIPASVASGRLDAVLAAAFGMSRSEAMEVIRREHVFVNGRMTAQCAYHPKEGDIISARGFGKARYEGAEGETRKGRIRIHIERYV